MYNSFIEDKRHKEQVEQQMRASTYRGWEKRHSQYRTRLIKRYEKRVENFIYRMEQNPIEMKSGDRMELTLRDENNSKNITKSHFRLKDQRDWKSIYTSSERLQMERHRKRYQHVVEKVKDQLLNRNVASQSPYQPDPLDKYRTREKDKEIQNRPMRFNYVPKMVMRKVLENKNTENEEEQNESKRNTNSNDSDEDNFSVGSKISKRNPTLPENTKRKRKMSKFSRNSKNSKESKKDQKKDQKKKMYTTGAEMRETEDPANIKLHFKAVMDILVRDKNMNKAAKDILRRCRLVKFKKIEEEAEKDLFQINKD